MASQHVAFMASIRAAADEMRLRHRADAAIHGPALVRAASFDMRNRMAAGAPPPAPPLPPPGWVQPGAQPIEVVIATRAATMIQSRMRARAAHRAIIRGHGPPPPPPPPPPPAAHLPEPEPEPEEPEPEPVHYQEVHTVSRDDTAIDMFTCCICSDVLCGKTHKHCPPHLDFQGHL